MSLGQIEVIIGGSPVHVTLTDQFGNPIPPAQTEWSGLTQSEGFTFSSDSTGWNFQAASGATARVEVGQAIYTGSFLYNPPGSPQTQNLVIVITSTPGSVPVSYLQYQTP